MSASRLGCLTGVGLGLYQTVFQSLGHGLPILWVCLCRYPHSQLMQFISNFKSKCCNQLAYEEKVRNYPQRYWAVQWTVQKAMETLLTSSSSCDGRQQVDGGEGKEKKLH